MAYLGLMTLASLMGLMMIIGLCVLYTLQMMTPQLLDDLRKTTAGKVNDIVFRAQQADGKHVNELVKRYSEAQELEQEEMIKEH